MNVHDYLPTPKMTAALLVGAIGVIAVLAADWLELADVRPAAAGLFVLILAELGGWFKSDASSPARLRARRNLEEQVPDNSSDR